MKKGDVGRAKHFSKKYRNKGWAFNYPVSAIWKKICSVGMPDATSLNHCLENKQLKHLNAFSGKDPAKGCTLRKGVANTCIYMSDHTPMQLEKYYTCCIERRWYIPYNPSSARLATGLFVFNAWIQLNVVQYRWWFWRQWCRGVTSSILTEQKIISDCRYKVIESSSLVTE